MTGALWALGWLVVTVAVGVGVGKWLKRRDRR